jgi:hypothetical protein
MSHTTRNAAGTRAAWHEGRYHADGSWDGLRRGEQGK